MTRQLFSLFRPTLLALATFLLFVPSRSHAEDKIEYSIGGQYRVRGFSLRNGSFARLLDPETRRSLRDNDVVDIKQRQNYFDTRLRLSFSASRGQSLSLNTQFEIGDLTFGGNGAGIGTDGVNIETKWLYLEWTPSEYDLTLRAGLYSEVTPQSMILSDDVAGLRVKYSPAENITLTLNYIKAVDQSRVDLDADGVVDNDFNDRDIWIGQLDITKFQPFTFALYSVVDIDNSNDSPVAQNLERDVYWFGASVKGRVGLASFSLDGIYAVGRQEDKQANQRADIEGFAIDGRLFLEFPYVGVETIVGWGSGDDPKTNRIEAFPTISTFYAHSNIIFDDYGGFNVTGSSLSEVAHLSILVSATPIQDLKLTAIAIYAIYTEDQRRSTNVNRLNLKGRELGWELGLNMDYTVNENLSFVSRNGIFFPLTGYLTRFDSPDDDLLMEFVLGAEFRF